MANSAIVNVCHWVDKIDVLLLLK